jgi:hypothetical protein
MRKQCKRKIYALVNPITMAIEGACITTEDKQKTLEERESKALEDIMSGKGTPISWQHLVDLNNLCQEMGRNGIGPECLVDCMMAELELKAAAKRYKKTGKMGLTATGIKSIQQVQEWHSLQRKSISRSQYEVMIKKTVNKIKSKAKGVEEIV